MLKTSGFLGVALSLTFLLPAVFVPAEGRAEDMDLILSRLSTGRCARTLKSAGAAGTPFELRDAKGRQTLSANESAWRKLVVQLSPALTPAVLAPVTTSGARGVDVSVQTGVTGISSGADYWRDGSEGHGAASVDTCDGENRAVDPVLTSTRLAFQKGLPLGVTLGVELGRLWNTRLWTIGGSIKVALLEGYPRLPAPDVALRATGSTAVGDSQYSLTTVTGDLLLSKNLVAAQTFTLAPYGGVGTSFTFASSQLVDLTPNIDAARCQQGLDKLCNAKGLGMSKDDVGHDVPFDDLTIQRYRGFLGLMFRYRVFSIAAEIMTDLVAPHSADKDAGVSQPRQWTFNVAPALSY